MRQIAAYVAEHNPAAAERLGELIQASAERLVVHPYSHRVGRAPGTREAVVHPNYILIYEVHVDTVEIMAVVHSRREYPPAEE